MTTIPIQKKTRDLLKSFASKSETWDSLLNRLYQNAVTTQHAASFLDKDSVSIEEACRMINADALETPDLEKKRE